MPANSEPIANQLASSEVAYYQNQAELLRVELRASEGRLADLMESHDKYKDRLNYISNEHAIERDFLHSRIEELQNEVAEMTNTEKVLMDQVSILKEEMDRLRAAVKSASGDTVRQHLKSTFLNWIDFMAKSKKTEAITLFNLLENQFEMQNTEKADLIGNLDKLKLKKKTV